MFGEAEASKISLILWLQENDSTKIVLAFADTSDRNS